MRVIIRWRRPDTHELPRTDLDHRHARIVVEVGDDMFRHGHFLMLPRLARQSSGGTIAGRSCDA